MAEILVLYYSRSGATAELARQVCRGVESAGGASARLHTVPPVAAQSEAPGAAGAGEQPRRTASLEDLRDTHGLVLDGPTRFGNMAAPLKYFHSIPRRPVAVEARWPASRPAYSPPRRPCTADRETTLLSMMLLLLHHGMYLVGLPYTERALNEIQRRRPYGRLARQRGGRGALLTGAERSLAQALGRRVALFAVQLSRR